ncbi:MAG: S8 family serine peptidase, partial [Anaerolineae bacterium]
MIWKRLCLLNAVFLAGLLLTVTVGTLVALARSQDDQPALPRLNPRLDIMHHDKWPAQLPGPTSIDRIRSTQPTFAPDRVLVKFHPGAKPTRGPAGILQTGLRKLDRLLAEQGIERATPLFPAPIPPDKPYPAKPADSPDLSRIYRLQLKPGSDVPQVATALTADPDVEYAEPDYIARQADAPDDPRYGEQWALQKIQIEGAWTVVTGTSAIVIAMVDSGIDLEHPDLVPNLWTNPGEVPDNGVDDDGNGFVDDVRGWNFVSGSNDVGDDNGHGTLVAGIAAARTDNGTGIAGVCGQCRTMPVKVMQPSGVANYSDIAAGVAYAAAKGARVINLSLGGYANSRALQDAIAYAVSQNVVVVGGAGNDNTSRPFYPAAYDDVIAVAGTTISDTRAAFSNYGPWVDLSAPGEDILTTALGGDYVQNSGTSMAAAYGAGLAGLLLSLHPDWTPALVRAQLMHTADSIDVLNPSYEGQLGSGRLNAAQAIQPPVPILTYAGYSINGTSNGRPEFGADVALTVSVYNDWADAQNVTGTLSTADPYVTVVTDTAVFGDISSGQTVANSVPFSTTIDTTAGYNHPIPFTLALSANNGGYTATLAFTVTTRSSEEI